MLLLELHWCLDCGADTGLERPSGDGSPEGACVDCGSAVFLWSELPEEWAQPAAMSRTPASAVATPAA